MTGYVFYDTETTGTLTAYDQILQFGAIRTDEDLNEINRFEIRCRIMPHIVPATKALEVTGVTPNMLIDPSLPSHYEAMRKIHKTLSDWSPAVFIGFNSISFDEPLLRQAFYQTLQPIYLTNTGGNCRADLLRIVHAASVYAPRAISVPIGDNDRPVYRLDRLAPANGFAHTEAHEAMADVEATIYMAKLVKDHGPGVWTAMMARARKQDVFKFLDSSGIVCLTEFFAARPHSRLATSCGSNPNYDAEHAVFDLSYMPEDYLRLSVDALVDEINMRAKPIRVVRTNAQPILIPLELAPPNLFDSELPIPEYERRAAVIRQDLAFHERVGLAIAKKHPEQEPSPYIEEKIYDGFASSADQSIMAQFHHADWEHRSNLAENLQDPRLKQLAYRLIYFERADLLPKNKRHSFDNRIAERLLTNDPDVPWRTIPTALQQTENLIASGVDDDLANFYRDAGQYLKQKMEYLIAS